MCGTGLQVPHRESERMHLSAGERFRLNPREAGQKSLRKGFPLVSEL